MRSHLSLHGFLNMQQTAKEYVRAWTTESHPLHDELKYHKVILMRPEYIIPWTIIARDIPEDVVPVDNITSDPWVVYNDKLLLVEAMGANIMLKCRGQYLESREACASTCTIIATVGSFRDNFTASGGMVWQNNREII